MGQSTRQQFRNDNTEGYTARELAELNRRFDLALAEYDEAERDNESIRAAVAERVLADFDGPGRRTGE
jgi:hypothetical protein